MLSCLIFAGESYLAISFISSCFFKAVSFNANKNPQDGIKARKSWLLNVMYVGLYINFDVLTVVNIWLPVLCVVPPCSVCF